MNRTSVQPVQPPRSSSTTAKATSLTHNNQGPTKPLIPPFPSPLPLWLALLLKRQKRANIQPPRWLTTTSLSYILELEIDHAGEAFSPPPKLPPPSTTSTHTQDTDPRALEEAYLASRNIEPSSPFLGQGTQTALPDALPYHWLEMVHLLLTHAAEDFEDADTVRRLIRDLREVRMAKVRKGIEVLDAGAGVQMNGVGGMEVAECRGFIGGVVDGLRKIGASREQARREQEEQGSEDGGGQGYDEDEDDDML